MAWPVQSHNISVQARRSLQHQIHKERRDVTRETCTESKDGLSTPRSRLYSLRARFCCNRFLSASTPHPKADRAAIALKTTATTSALRTAA